jgi:undecaprenyl-diphosphatase
MIAVVVYFWRRWRLTFFRDRQSLIAGGKLLLIATALTGLIGETVVVAIERIWLGGTPYADVEDLFGHLGLIATALAAVGCLILCASARERRAPRTEQRDLDLNVKQAGIVGIVQGLCLPFRGFSRSGATISMGMLIGIDQRAAEDFSFALAVLLTPPVVLRELWRVVRAHGGRYQSVLPALSSGLLGAACAFVAGVVALRWLSGWLETGRWQWFGMYCLVAAAAVATLHYAGF